MKKHLFISLLLLVSLSCTSTKLKMQPHQFKLSKQEQRKGSKFFSMELLCLNGRVIQMSTI